MLSPTNNNLKNALSRLESESQYRRLPNLVHQGRHVIVDGEQLLNVSGNDYLGIGSDNQLLDEFFEKYSSALHNQIDDVAHYSTTDNIPNGALQRDCIDDALSLGSVSSRLLTGNHIALQRLETELVAWYHMGRPTAVAKPMSKPELEHVSQNEPTLISALVFNSGYHANIGILPALAALPIQTLIVADKRVHASLIDGLRLSQSKYCTYTRYRHNDLEHLRRIIERATSEIERIIIVTESVFSMDGDRADLAALVSLKAQDARIELYVDEAHAIGVLGEHGLGLSEVTGTGADIDYIIGTFGKAFASIGAYVICSPDVREWLINQMRSLIYSTALPPINHNWTRFILAKMPFFNDRRKHLAMITQQVQQSVAQTLKIVSVEDSDPAHRSISEAYQSPIVPYILGDNASAIAKAKQLRQAGFYTRAVRPPTVPLNSARLRLVMTASLTLNDCQRLVEQL